jgi:hypothetical protein
MRCAYYWLHAQCLLLVFGCVMNDVNGWQMVVLVRLCGWSGGWLVGWCFEIEIVVRRAREKTSEKKEEKLRKKKINEKNKTNGLSTYPKLP